MDHLEYILCSAIWYKDISLVKKNLPNQNPINVDRGAVFCGHRHPHCMYTMIAITGKRSVESEIGKYEQGFLTSKNRFVDRKEAALIAINAKQIKYKLTGDRLFSENLY